MPALDQLDKRQRIMVLVLLPAVLVGGLGYLNWKKLAEIGPDPSLPIRRSEGIYNEIVQLEQDIAAQELIIADGPKVSKELESLRESIAAAEERLPLEAEKAEMRQLIERLASEAKVAIKGVRISEGPLGKKGQEYQTVTYRTDFDGDFNGVIRYVNAIEKNTRFMALRQLSIRPGALSLDSEQQKVVMAPHSVTMELITYVYSGGPAPRRQ